jgi:cephalosporin-C deacetylase-like acetyl esterase
MYSRHNIQFTSAQTTLRGWFYAPTQLEWQVPGIIMTPGFSALKEHHYEAFALALVHAGLCVLLYDNRNFGDSDGEPRFEVDPGLQVSDMRAAIDFLQQQKDVEPNKIGLWGSSFSAGIVLAVAAQDKRARCVVAQVPFVQGHHRELKSLHPEVYQAWQTKYSAERARIAAGELPTMVAVVTSDPEKSAVMKQPAAFQFFTALPDWKNQVTLKSIENAGEFFPIDRMADLAPTPVLFIVAEQDTVNSPELALAAFAKTAPPKKIVMLKGGHFDPHGDLFGFCAKEACEWFLSHL